MELLKKNMPVRLFVLAFLILTAVFRNGNILSFIPGFGAFIFIPCIVCIAMFETEIVSVLFGILAGILWDYSSAAADGVFAAALGIIALITSILCKFVLRKKLSSSVALSGLFLIITAVIYSVMSSPVTADRQFISAVSCFPEAVFSGLFIPVYYFIFKSLYSEKNSEEIKL